MSANFSLPKELHAKYSTVGGCARTRTRLQELVFTFAGILLPSCKPLVDIYTIEISKLYETGLPLFFFFSVLSSPLLLVYQRFTDYIVWNKKEWGR